MVFNSHIWGYVIPHGTVCNRFRFQMEYYAWRWEEVSAPMKLKDIFEGI